MNKIYWICIIDRSGATVVRYENQVPGNNNGNSPVWSHILYALRSIANTLKENEIGGLEIGNYKFFLCKEKKSNYLFILKSNRDADSLIITPFLLELKNKFLVKIKGPNNLPTEGKIQLLNSFREDIRQLIKEYNHDFTTKF